MVSLYHHSILSTIPRTHHTNNDLFKCITCPIDPAEAPKSEEEQTQDRLVQASSYLKAVIDSCKGDAGALQRRVQNELWTGELPFEIEHFKRVVQDNLAASEQAG